MVRTAAGAGCGTQVPNSHWGLGSAIPLAQAFSGGARRSGVVLVGTQMPR